MSYLSVACKSPTGPDTSTILTCTAFISVFSAVMIVMIAVGVERPYKGTLSATVDTSLYEAFLAVCNIVFSFCGSLSLLH